MWREFRTLLIALLVVGTLCAYSIVRFRTGGENLAVWILSQRMLPRSALTQSSSSAPDIPVSP